MTETLDREYQVEAIRKWFWLKDARIFAFEIKWVGWPEAENTIEPKENLSGCPEIYRTFLESLPGNERELLELKPEEYHRLDKLNGLQRNAVIESMSVDSIDYQVSRADDQSSKISTESLDTRKKLMMRVRFDDSKMTEKLGVEEISNYRPDEVLDFFEQRIVVKEDNVQGDV